MNLFKTRKSLSQILESFTDTIADLNALEADNIEQSDAKEAEIAILAHECRELDRESAKARAVATNLQKLIS